MIILGKVFIVKYLRLVKGLPLNYDISLTSISQCINGNIGLYILISNLFFTAFDIKILPSILIKIEYIFTYININLKSFKFRLFLMIVNNLDNNLTTKYLEFFKAYKPKNIIIKNAIITLGIPFVLMDATTTIGSIKDNISLKDVSQTFDIFYRPDLTVNKLLNFGFILIPDQKIMMFNPSPGQALMEWYQEFKNLKISTYTVFHLRGEGEDLFNYSVFEMDIPEKFNSAYFKMCGKYRVPEYLPEVDPYSFNSYLSYKPVAHYIQRIHQPA